MNTMNRTFHIARRTLALSALLSAGLVGAHAQEATAPATAVAAQPAQNFQVPMDVRETTFSSSSAENQIADVDSPFDFIKTADTQPPPRRSYGRPRYRGGNTNADGSNKYTFIAGVGFTVPTSTTSDTLKTNWGLQFGGGRNFNKTFGLLVQFDWDNFGFTDQTLNNQLAIYNSPQVFGPGALGQLNGNSHLWSFTLDPTVTFYSGDGFGAYAVGGIGFYHKTANFTTPVIGTSEDIFGDIFQFQANQTVDDYTSNAVGFNGGLGLTYKLSHFANQRLYAEVRYVFVDNSARPGFTIANISSAPPTATNFFPANSAHTTYIPVKFGIRF
jgi:hypothetical protein